VPFDLVVCAHVFVSLHAPLEQRVNSAAGWCGIRGNAPLVSEEGGERVRRINAGNGVKCRPLSVLYSNSNSTKYQGQTVSLRIQKYDFIDS